MIPSTYLRVFPDETPGQQLLYSTKRTSLVRVAGETARAVASGSLSDSDRALFRRLELIVEDTEAEQRAMLGYFDRLNARSTELDLIVVLTMACNFACPYCFEGELKGGRHLSRETADRLVEFIDGRLTPEIADLNVTFYGGEPLLAHEMIRHLSERLQDLAAARGKSWKFGLMTNGALLTPDRAEALIPLGLVRAQVTLDGPPRLHDRTRPLAAGGGSFDLILANLEAVSGLIEITLSGNYGPDTWREFVSLLDLLPDRGLTPDRIARVRFSPILKQAEEVRPAGACGSGCDSFDEPWIREASVLLRNAILERGYATPKPGPLHCMVELKNSLVVDWNGEIYKCPAFIGRRAFAAGDIRTGAASGEAYHPGVWKNPECLACPHLPQCFGGCRHMAALRHGRTDIPDCNRAWFDAVLPDMIRQDIRYGNPRKPAAG